ncbi:MAG: hypothetical protein ACK5P5_10060 [Pseudobdellovibrionaceae bacterium]
MRKVNFFNALALILIFGNLAFADGIRNADQLIHEVRKVTDETNQQLINRNFQNLMTTLMQSKEEIAGLPEEEYQSHQRIYIQVIELRQQLERIQLDQNAACVRQASNAAVNKSEVELEELKKSSIQSLFFRIYNKMCQQ